MKKKILLIALSVVIIATLAIGATLAYFTDTKEATNVFTVGNVKIELTEPNWDPDNARNVTPGSRIPKDPTVENTGTTDVYLRVKVQIPNAYALPVAPIVPTFPPMFISPSNPPKEIGYLSFVLNQDWTLNPVGIIDDNYTTYTFTHNTKLASGNTTAALFTQLVFATNLNLIEDVQGDTGNIIVKAEAIQADNLTNAAAAFAALDIELAP